MPQRLRSAPGLSEGGATYSSRRLRMAGRWTLKGAGRAGVPWWPGGVSSRTSGGCCCSPQSSPRRGNGGSGLARRRDWRGVGWLRHVPPPSCGGWCRRRADRRGGPQVHLRRGDGVEDDELRRVTQGLPDTPVALGAHLGPDHAYPGPRLLTVHRGLADGRRARSGAGHDHDRLAAVHLADPGGQPAPPRIRPAEVGDQQLGPNRPERAA
jgi:hypothetical protein